MATYSGQNGAFYIGSNLVAEISSWALTIDGVEIPINVFGTAWAKAQQGIKSWSCSIDGFYDPSDTAGQGALLTAFINGSVIPDAKFYVDGTWYYAPDTPNDANAGARVMSYSPSSSADNVAQMTCSLAGNGAIALFPPMGNAFYMFENSQYIPLLF